MGAAVWCWRWTTEQQKLAKDTNLPVMDRKSAVELIEERINSSWATEIVLPNDNISLWKSQFV